MRSSDAPSRLLVIGPSWVGDMVMAQSLFIALQKRHGPQLQIDVLAPGWSLPILQRMPEVRRGIEMPLGHGRLAIGERYRLGKTLRSEGYDQAIVLPNSLKSAFIPKFAGIPVRTGWRGEMRYGWLNDIRPLDKQRYPLMVERFVALAYPHRVPLDKPLPNPHFRVDPADVEQAMAAFDLRTTKPVLALCPGAEFGPSKQWPPAQYAEVARQALENGWQVWLFGSANDQAVCQQIVASMPLELKPCCINLAGRTSLAQAVDLLSKADAVVANDSGLMHVAAALQRPLVVVYGSTSPEFTPPLAEKVEIVSLGLDCAPCFERECPLGHGQCMQQLPAKMVFAALARLGCDISTALPVSVSGG